MTTEWKDITDPEELFRLKREGWEIEVVVTHVPDGVLWGRWDQRQWNFADKFRARARQPKMKKVKMLCWFTAAQRLVWEVEGCSNSYGWIRIPAQDIEIEVPE